MEYLKIFTSFDEVIEPLNDAERGRLLTAMLEYADREEVPEFRGNERFVWPIAKQAIDRERARIDQLHANGSRGGRPSKTKENQTKPNETKENQRKPNETYKEKDKDKDKFDDEDMMSNDLCACAREALTDLYPNSTIPEIWPEQLACRAEEYELDGRMVYEAVNQAAEHGAASPVAYAMRVMQDMYEHGDRNRMAYAIRRMHEGYT